MSILCSMQCVQLVKMYCAEGKCSTTKMCDDAMEPKFFFVEITPISKVSSISVIKCEGCSFNTIKDSTRFVGSLGLVFNRLPRTCRHKLSTSFARTRLQFCRLVLMVSRFYPQTLSFSDFFSLCTFLVVMLVTSFQDFGDSIRFVSD